MVEITRKSKTLTTSWILLLVQGVLLILVGLGSLGVAYFHGEDQIVEGVAVEKLAQVDPRLPTALRARRATAAALSLSLGILVAWIAATAYRRGERWAWPALLVSIGVGSVLSLLRFVMLDTTQGLAPASIALGVQVVALLIAYRDFH